MADNRKFSVQQWTQPALQASSMRAGACEHPGMVGIDMIAQDGNVFAHGHFDIETAMEFHRYLGIAIDQAVEKEGK